MRNSKGQFVKGHNFNLGRECSDNTKLKISKANEGKSLRIGYRHTEATKDKIRRGHLKRGLSVLKNCEVCGKQFKVPNCRINARFCSCKCRSMVIMPSRPSRNGCKPWNKGLNKHTDIKIARMSKNRLGRDNWMWKENGNITKWRDTNKRDLERWRISVFKRDNYICQKCGQRGGVLNAHHKILVSDDKSLALNVNNGETLCFKCHKYVHSK